MRSTARPTPYKELSKREKKCQGLNGGKWAWAEAAVFVIATFGCRCRWSLFCWPPFNPSTERFLDGEEAVTPIAVVVVAGTPLGEGRNPVQVLSILLLEPTSSRTAGKLLAVLPYLRLVFVSSDRVEAYREGLVFGEDNIVVSSLFSLCVCRREIEPASVSFGAPTLAFDSVVFGENGADLSLGFARFCLLPEPPGA